MTRRVKWEWDKEFLVFRHRSRYTTRGFITHVNLPRRMPDKQIAEFAWVEQTSGWRRGGWKRCTLSNDPPLGKAFSRFLSPTLLARETESFVTDTHNPLRVIDTVVSCPITMQFFFFSPSKGLWHSVKIWLIKMFSASNRDGTFENDDDFNWGINFPGNYHNKWDNVWVFNSVCRMINERLNVFFCSWNEKRMKKARRNIFQEDGRQFVRKLRISEQDWAKVGLSKEATDWWGGCFENEESFDRSVRKKIKILKKR